MAKYIPKFVDFLLKNNILILISIIVLIHSFVLSYFFVCFNRSEVTLNPKVIGELPALFVLQNKADTFQEVIQLINNISKKQTILDTSRIIISITRKPRYSIVSEYKSNPWFYQFSQAIDKTHWINFKIETSNEIYIYFIFLILIDIMILGLYLFHHMSLYRFKAPLTNFKLGAQKLGIDINAEPLDIKGPKIIQEVASAMNNMQIRIRDLMNAQTRMLMNISHDLRTPITRLQLRSHMLGNSDEGKAMLNDLSEIEEMISEILSASYNVILHKKSTIFEVRSLISSICEDYCDQGHCVEISTACGSILFFGNRLALKRAFTNLISNSINYATNVFVCIKQSDNEITVIIEDDGPGIPTDEINRVFEPYYRGKSALFYNQKGKGLGLSIATEIIQSYAGTISLINKPTQGLLVNVRLPLNVLARF